MSSCFRTSNNFYASAPPRMADGRHFTDYRPNCHLNNRIQTENQVSNSYEYRMFLTRNADDLMELNRKESYLLNGSYECKPPYEAGTMLPESDKVVCNRSTCNVVHNFDDGLGRGRDYGEATCLASFQAPQMKLDGNQCRPESHLDGHQTKQFVSPQVQAYFGAGDRPNVNNNVPRDNTPEELNNALRFNVSKPATSKAANNVPENDGDVLNTRGVAMNSVAVAGPSDPVLEEEEQS